MTPGGPPGGPPPQGSGSIRFQRLNSLSGSLAIRNSGFSGFRPIFGRTWPQNPSRTTGLVLQCRLHQISAPQSNSKAIPWQFGILSSHPFNEPLSSSNLGPSRGRFRRFSIVCRGPPEGIRGVPSVAQLLPSSVCLDRGFGMGPVLSS